MGERDRFSVRPPVPVGERVREEARKAGLSQGELICRIVAQHFNMPTPPDGATIHQLSQPADVELSMTG
jgi:hypothetical protein